MNGILTSILRAGLGLSGLGAVVFLGGMQGWLQIEILTSMTSDQLFLSFVISMFCTTVVTLVLIVSHQISKNKKKNRPKEVTTVATDNARAVTTTGDASPVNIGDNNGAK